MTAIETSLLRIGDFPREVTQEQSDFLQREGFIQFGRLLSEEELIPLRFAYERVWEANPLPEEQCDGKAAPGHRALSIEHFCHETELVRMISNEHFLCVAGAALQLPVEEIEFAGGYVHRQRCQRVWTYEDFGWPGWHKDGHPTFDPLSHINIWIYLDDCTKMDGVTQALLGSCEHQRQNLKDGIEPDTGLDILQEEQDTLKAGVFAEGPAGGGFCWSGFLVHRITPNRSGRPRRLITWEYRPKAKEDSSLFQDKTTREQRAVMAEMLPEDFRFLVDF